MQTSRTILSVVLLSVIAATSSAQDTPQREAKAKQFSPMEYDGLPYQQLANNTAGVEKPALVVFLHGGHARGEDNLAQIRLPAVAAIKDYILKSNIPAYFLVPQCPADHEWVPNRRTPGCKEKVVGLIRKYAAEKDIDTNRIYLCSVSMGSWGSWVVVKENPKLFAAAFIASGMAKDVSPEHFADTPLFVTVGSRERTADDLKRFVAEIKKSGGTVEFDTLDGCDHPRACSEAFTAKRLEWLFSQRRADPAIHDTGNLEAAFLPFGEASNSARIARFPVTNADYAKFVKKTGHQPPRYWQDGAFPAGKDKHPVLWVSLRDAEAYCAWLGAKDPAHSYRLPTAAEWETAAGPTPRDAEFNSNAVIARRLLAENPGRLIEYVHPKSVRKGEKDKLSDVISLTPGGGVRGWVDHANFTGFIYTDLFKEISDAGGGTTPVDAYPQTKTACGALDMWGNCWEWTSTEIVARNGRERGEKVNAIKGGSWYAMRNSCRTDYKGEGRRPGGCYNTVGFRVVAVPKANKGSK